MKINSHWRIWAKAIGEKASNNNKEADVVAIIRTIILFIYIITNLFIVSGVVRHWNDNKNTINIIK